MDITQYIESGVLELYVLGRLSAREAQEVVANAAQYPEIAAEIGRIETVLEDLAFRMAEDVSPEVLERTMREIRNQSTGGSTNVPPATGSPGWLPWLLTLAALVMAGAFWIADRNTNTQLADTQLELAELQEKCNTAEAQSEATNDILAALTRPATRNITLEGTDNAPDKRAVVFYNTEDEAAYFSASNLPAPPAGKQYQLWGIDGDGPKSLGVLDLDLETGAILDLDYLPGVAVFAITLEDLGGQDAPDLEQLQVLGEV